VLHFKPFLALKRNNIGPSRNTFSNSSKPNSQALADLLPII